METESTEKDLHLSLIIFIIVALLHNLIWFIQLLIQSCLSILCLHSNFCFLQIPFKHHQIFHMSYYQWALCNELSFNFCSTEFAINAAVLDMLKILLLVLHAREILNTCSYPILFQASISMEYHKPSKPNLGLSCTWFLSWVYCSCTVSAGHYLPLQLKKTVSIFFF